MDPQVTAQADTGSALPVSLRVEGAQRRNLDRRRLGHPPDSRRFSRAMRARRVDATLTRYLDASANVLLKALVLITILGVLGIQTTSFAALMAAAGIAIGAAWAGMLATSQPGCSADVSAVQGRRPHRCRRHHRDVREIGLFVTSIDTPDQVLTYVGNNKLFADNVQNFSANPFRRVDLTAQVPPSVNLLESIGRLRDGAARSQRARAAGSRAWDPDLQPIGVCGDGAAMLPQRVIGRSTSTRTA
jgi:hypothetical protein